jgi:hypothetical protein
MSDEEEEEEEDYEEEVGDSSENEEGDDIETDTGDDEGPSDRPEPDAGRNSKSRPEKENAKKRDGLKRKMEIASKDEKKKKMKKSVESKKPKMSAAAAAVKKTEKGKKTSKKMAEVDAGKEVQAEPIQAIAPSTSSDPTSGEKKVKEYPVFDERNVDYNYVKNSSSVVVQRRCQVTDNIILHCKNIEITTAGVKHDYASLTFSRKTKTGKSFDYNLPLKIAPILVEAIQQIINDNSKYFADPKNK